MLPERKRVLLTRNLKGLRQQGRSSLLIRFYVERRVKLLEILRIASTRRVQPSDSFLRRGGYCYLKSKGIVSARRVQPSGSISRRKARNHGI